METLQHLKEITSQKTLTKVNITPNGRVENISNLIEELDVKLVAVKPLSLKQDWFNFTNSFGNELLTKISF